MLPVLNNTSVDLDAGKYETIKVTKTAVTSGVIASAGSVLVVANVDVFIDVGSAPDCTKQFGLVPAGPSGVLVWLTNPGEDFVSVRTVSDTEGYVTLYVV